MALPDVFVIGAPKAGSTAVHAALATHPDIFTCDPKEPKYFLCGDQAPAHQAGPGDNHSKQEWIWQRDRYEALFDGACDGQLRVESTPFYLWDKASHARISVAVPNARLIAVVRDPVDRAYSNWTHLWSDGYEPIGDFVTAAEQEGARIAAGWAPMWRYLEVGRYGEQLEHLYRFFAPEQVLVIRYRDLAEEPLSTLATVAAFLDLDPAGFTGVRGENVTAWAEDTAVNRVLRAAVRTGSWAGQFAPPQVWRTVERPIRSLLHRGSALRPELTEAQRAALLPHFAEDIVRLSDLTGRDFRDWLGTAGRGAYAKRTASAADPV